MISGKDSKYDIPQSIDIELYGQYNSDNKDYSDFRFVDFEVLFDISTITVTLYDSELKEYYKWKVTVRANNYSCTEL